MYASLRAEKPDVSQYLSEMKSSAGTSLAQVPSHSLLSAREDDPDTFERPTSPSARRKTLFDALGQLRLPFRHNNAANGSQPTNASRSVSGTSTSSTDSELLQTPGRQLGTSHSVGMMSQSGELALGPFEWEGAGGKAQLHDELSPDLRTTSAASTGSLLSTNRKAEPNTLNSINERLSSQDLASLSALLTALINRRDVRLTESWKSFACIRENDMDKRTETLERAQWQRKGLADLFDREERPESHEQLKSRLKLRKSRSYAGDMAEAHAGETVEQTQAAEPEKTMDAAPPAEEETEPQSAPKEQVATASSEEESGPTPVESEAPTPRPQPTKDQAIEPSAVTPELTGDIDATIKRAVLGRRLVTKDNFEPIRVLGKGCAGKVGHSSILSCTGAHVFRQVLLVRHKNTRLVYAMKVIVKRAVFAHQELKHTLVSNDCRSIEKWL